MAMHDRNGKPLKKGDRVKYIGNQMRDVSPGDVGTVKGEFTKYVIWVQFENSAKIPISQYSLEKV